MLSTSLCPRLAAISVSRYFMATVRWRGETYEVNEKTDRVRVPWPWAVPPRRLVGRKYINRGANRRLETWVEVAVRIEKEATQAEDQVRATHMKWRTRILIDCSKPRPVQALNTTIGSAAAVQPSCSSYPQGSQDGATTAQVRALVRLLNAHPCVFERIQLTAMSVRTCRAIERPCELCWSQQRPAPRMHRQPASGRSARTELPASRRQSQRNRWARHRGPSAASLPAASLLCEATHQPEVSGSSKQPVRAYSPWTGCVHRCEHHHRGLRPTLGLLARDGLVASSTLSLRPPELHRQGQLVVKWTSTFHRSFVLLVPTSSPPPMPPPPPSPTHRREPTNSCAESPPSRGRLRPRAAATSRRALRP